MSLIWNYGFTSYDIEISKILEEIDNDLKSFLDEYTGILLNTGSDWENTAVKYSDLRVSSQSKIFSNKRIKEIKKWLEINKTDFLESNFTKYSDYLDIMNEIILALDFPKYKFNQSDKDAVINDTALFTLRDNLITDAVYSKDFRENEQFIELCIEFYGAEYYQKYIKSGILGERDGNRDNLFMSISNIEDLADSVTTEEYKEYVRTVNKALPETYSSFFKDFKEEFLSLPIKYAESEPVERNVIKINKIMFLRHHVNIAGLLDSRDGYYIYEDSRWGFGNKLSWQNDKEAVVLEISALIHFKLELLYAKFNQIISKFEKQYPNLGLINQKATLSYLKRFYHDLANSESHHFEFLNVIDLPEGINKKIAKVIKCIIDYQIDLGNGAIAEKILTPSDTKGLFLGRMDLREKNLVKLDYSKWSEHFVKTKINWEIEGKDFLEDIFSLLYKRTNDEQEPLMKKNDVESILENNFSCYEGEAFPFNPKPKPNSIDKWVLRQFMYDFYKKCGAKPFVKKNRLVQFLIQNFEQFASETINDKKDLQKYASYLNEESCPPDKKIIIPDSILRNTKYMKFVRREYRT